MFKVIFDRIKRSGLWKWCCMDSDRFSARIPRLQHGVDCVEWGKWGKCLPGDHPLRKLRNLVDEVLAEIGQALNTAVRNEEPLFIPPDRVLRAMALQVFYSIRSARNLGDQLNHNPLFRRFTDISVEHEVWPDSSLMDDRSRLLDLGIAQRFLARMSERAWTEIDQTYSTVDQVLLDYWIACPPVRPDTDAPASTDNVGRLEMPTGANPEAQATSRALSTRESQILVLIGQGRTTKEISLLLGISSHTVGQHRKHLCRKLRAHSTAELASIGCSVTASADCLAFHRYMDSSPLCAIGDRHGDGDLEDDREVLFRVRTGHAVWRGRRLPETRL
ncbi:MAG: transposase [Bryobacteraceae bacterium]|nr:transposase [Bryobacteraceae bacterium]